MKEIRCEPCQKTFASKEAEKMHQIAKHSTADKEEQKELLQEHHKQKKGRKKIVWYGVAAVISVLLVWGIFTLSKEGTSYSGGQVHWHADLSFTVCGKNIPLPKPLAGTSVHGEPFIGTPFMHLHNEPQIHIEGAVKEASDITLGRFMDGIGLKFTDTEFLDKKNGDACPDGSFGKVKLLVNGKESVELSKKVIVDGEEYRIEFG